MCLEFRQTDANGLRHKSPRPGDKRHLDEVFLKINGCLHYLLRVVDQEDEVLDILVQRHRDRTRTEEREAPYIFSSPGEILEAPSEYQFLTIWKSERI